MIWLPGSPAHQDAAHRPGVADAQASGCRGCAWPAGSPTGRRGAPRACAPPARRPRARPAAPPARAGTMASSSATSLPSVSPKPPGSMKSRCMSMMTSAVRAELERRRRKGRRRRCVMRPAAAGRVAWSPPPMWAPSTWRSAVAARRLEHDAPLAHHDDAVGQLQQLVEVFADQQHRAALRRAPARCAAWISATAAKSRPNTGLAAISTLMSPASSRASTARCTLPPDRLRIGAPSPWVLTPYSAIHSRARLRQPRKVQQRPAARTAAAGRSRAAPCSRPR